MSSTQDVRFSEEKIAMGRSFANKLWNAARFVLLGCEGYAAERGEADRLGPLDREPVAALPRSPWRRRSHEYDFTAAVDALYHFVWDDFCDWYLELVKVRLYGDDETQKAQAAGHARWMLDRIVRLLHPFMPFVTEEIADQYGVGAAPRAGPPASRPGAARARGREGHRRAAGGRRRAAALPRRGRDPARQGARRGVRR